MKHLLTMVVFYFCIFTHNLRAQVVPIPDLNFKKALIALGVDTNLDGEIQTSEALVVKQLEFSTNFPIDSLNGLSYFENLTRLSFRSKVKKISIIGMQKLKSLNIEYTESKNLRIENMNALDSIRIANIYGLESSYINNLPSLEILILSTINISFFDFPQFSKLKKVVISSTNIALGDFTSNIDLQELEWNNSTLDLLNVSTLTKLKSLKCSANDLENLKYANNPLLEYIEISNCAIEYFHLVDLPSLSKFVFTDNKTKRLAIRNTEKLSNIYCNKNANLRKVEFENCPIITEIDFNYTSLDSLSVQNLPLCRKIGCSYSNSLRYLKIVNMKELLSIACSSGLLDSMVLAELPKLKYLTIDGNRLRNLDVSNLPQLAHLNAEGNKIEALICERLDSLNVVYIRDNFPIKFLKMSNLPNLSALWVRDAALLAKIVLENIPKIQDLKLERTGFDSLTLENCKDIYTFNLTSGKLKYLKLSNISVRFFWVTGHDNLEEVNLSSVINYFLANFDKLTVRKFFIKNGYDDSQSFYNSQGSIGNFPNLYICCDKVELDTIVAYLKEAKKKFPNNQVHVNTYCTFKPGGKSATLTSKVLIDQNGVGCDSSSYLPNQTIEYYRENFGKGVFFTNNNTTSVLSVDLGQYEFKLTGFNEKLFTVDPQSVSVNFTDSLTAANQVFCLKPIGIQNDVEVKMFPLSAAKPGFSSRYLLRYENLGNTKSNGRLSIKFPNDVLKFISSQPTNTSALSGEVSWDYFDLKPFESRKIFVDFLLNKPTDSIPLVGTETLYFTAVISALPDDFDAKNNIAILSQKVTNSYDPNDKVCAQGDRILSKNVGGYLDYIVRFENIGTSAARNVVVKDVIDTATYQINSIVPLAASHAFVMKVEGNVVEFVFEGINLPFSDSLRNGYIAFKIKTRTDILVGDTIRNNAEIYFDYNFPIITNFAITRVEEQITSLQPLDEADILIFPNPAAGRYINFSCIKKIDKIEIFDEFGRILITKVLPDRIVDLNEVECSRCFIRFHSNGATFVRKLLINR